MRKRLISIICILSMFANTAFASVIGNEVTSWSHEIATGTMLHKNIFMSEQESVGQQVEYIAEYEPNENVIPTVATGASVWGLRNIKEAEEYMEENGMVPLIGINAAYFSLQTGVTMGHLLSYGKILSKDGMTYNGIAFNKDGTAFIAPFSIKTTLCFEDNEVDIEHINKYGQEVVDIVTLYTPDFGSETYNDCMSLSVILGNVSGDFSLGETISATVEDKFTYQGSVSIPQDKFILNINLSGKPELFEAINSLEIGDTVEITSECVTDERWYEADSGIASVGELLVKNGEVQSNFAIGAAPRTAVGITEDGNVIFYVIDGRQKPYSYGVQLKTLAERMKELGCVDAINLDGGGSTAISGIYPGTDNSVILNSPSDGRLRACSNYLFLKNAMKPTNKPGKLYLYPFEQHYLSGYSEKITPAAVDTSFYKIETPDDLIFSVTGESVIDNEGNLTAIGDGKFSISVTGDGMSGSAEYNVYKNPTDIDVYNSKKGTKITKINAKNGDIFSFDMVAKYNDIELKATKDKFKIEIDESIGEITEDGISITSKGGEGEVRVIVEEFVKHIPVSVKRENPFFDTDGHWAESMIKAVYEKKIISGYESDIGLCFAPENNITREEFAIIMGKFLGLDTEVSGDEIERFADKEEISDWAMPYVSAVVKASLINGKFDGELLNFAPKDHLTRAEAMTILGRTMETVDSKMEFSDIEEIPEWAVEYVSTMVSHGYVNGYDNRINPNDNITRVEIVTIIYKMLD